MEETTSPTDSGAVWAKYGLKSSPYSTDPTRLVGNLPIDKVFSGRKREVDILKRTIRSTTSSRTLIAGNFGVGKTTFANYVRWILCIRDGEKSRYLTTSTEIKVQPEWDATRFLLSTLAAIHNASIVFDWERNGLSFKSLRRIAEIVTTTTQRGFEASIFGVGGGYSESKASPSIITPEILEQLLAQFCSELLKQGKSIIIPYDNLENVESARVSQLFIAIRDYLQIDGLHTLFIGPPTVIGDIEAHGQVHSVFTPHLILDPLESDDVLDILQKRCEVLKTEGGSYIRPYEERTVVEIYESLRNIRFTFKVLEDATLLSAQEAPSLITMDNIVAVQQREKEQIFSKLTENQTKILSALMTHERLSQKELSEITGIQSTNLPNRIQELTNRGLITPMEGGKDKRFKYVKLSDNSYLKLVFSAKKRSLDERRRSKDVPGQKKISSRIERK